MAYSILGTPKPAFFDSSGSPLVSGTLTIQDPDDDSAKATYPTAADADAQTNGTTAAITLDSRGEPSGTQLWGRGGEDYKVIVKDSSGATVYTLDEIRLPRESTRSVVTAGSADTTPTVKNADILTLLNGVVYADFDDANIGDRLLVKGPASGTSFITDSGNIQLANRRDISIKNDHSIEFIYDGSTWIEIGRCATGTSTVCFGTITEYVGSDQSLTSSTLADVIQNIFLTGLTYYKVTGYLHVSADAGARDFELDFVPDTAFTDSMYTWISVDAGNALAVDQGETQALETAVANIDIDGTGNVGIIINGFCYTGGTTASVTTLDVQAANQSGAGTVTLHRGSWISFEPIVN